MDYDISGAAAELARWQAGAISRQQLLAAGLTPQMITTRLERQRWQQLYRGVYATFTGPPPRKAWLWGAVLRAGPGAVLSHLTAAELHGLSDSQAEAIFVTVPATRRITAPEIIVRTSSRITEARQPNREPPRTSVEETVLDLTQLSWTFDDACGCATTGATSTATPARPPCFRPASCASAAGPASPGRARQPALSSGHTPGHDPQHRFAEFTPITSTTTGGSASHLVRLGESGTPSLVFMPGNP
jgi:hypothetical protein